MDDAPPLSPDHEPFGRPLFSADGLSVTRVGVVDIGSNSVRFVVFDGAARSPAYFFNEKIMCALGAGQSETGRLNPRGRERALRALHRFAALAEGMGSNPLTVFATAAVREAEDGAEFCADVEAATGLTVHVIPGQEEARLSAQGVLLGWPGSYGLVCDIGGSSMEMADLADGKVGRRLTSPLGPLKLRDVPGGRKALKAHIAEVVARLRAQMGNETDMRLFLVGGSWRAFGRIDMERRGYPLSVLHEYRMTTRAVAATGEYIAKSDLQALRSKLSISEDRMNLVPYAALVLRELTKAFRPKDIAVSSYGIREGMLYEHMPESLRARDPLLEACRFAETKDARLPGFGAQLYDFVLPLFPRADWQKRRIIEAACLLHDVSWRAHPEYRAEVCFDNATRANLGGLKHGERIYLGLALLHRYQNKREGTPYESLFALIEAPQLREAEVLGKAMRLGAMLWLGRGPVPGHFRWHPQKKHLEVILEPKSERLWGEVAAARLNSLASALNATHQVSTRKPLRA